MLDAVVSALSLPGDALVDKRIPKKMLAEQGAPTTTDKQQIQDGIEELKWVAALKPTNISVPVFRNAEREYIEVAILTVSYRQNAKVSRLTELIHRAIPYPVLLVSAFHDADIASVGVSAAHKRFSLNETGKFIVDDILTTQPIRPDAMQASATRAFLDTLPLSKLPTQDLFAFYQGWLNSIVGFMTSSITGAFSLPQSTEQTGRMRECITNHKQILDKLTTLRTDAEREKQINRLVDINLEIKRLESQLAENKSALNGNPL